MIFAASSYEETLFELDTGQANQNTRLQSYREVYDCLKLPLFLLPCNETGCLQLRILGVSNYRELLAKIILKSKYVPPPENRPVYDALYQGVPFVMAADMDLRPVSNRAGCASRTSGNRSEPPLPRNRKGACLYDYGCGIAGAAWKYRAIRAA